MLRSSAARTFFKDRSSKAPFRQNSQLQLRNVSYSGKSSISAVIFEPFPMRPLQPVNHLKNIANLNTVPAPLTRAITKIIALTAAAFGLVSSVQPVKLTMSHARQVHPVGIVETTQLHPINVEPPSDASAIQEPGPPYHNRQLAKAIAARTQSSKPSPAAVTKPGGYSTGEPDPEHMTPNPAAGVVPQALRYLGVPFVWGGTTPHGFDCSGFVQYVMKTQGIELPRLSFEQVHVGIGLGQAGLAPGDLVFFQTDEPGASHVGIYIGNRNFVHADATRGISIASLNNAYWSAHYLTARRIVK